VHPQTAARAWDDDEGFVLIELAYVLPKWLKPETASMRVYVSACCLTVLFRLKR